MFDLTASPPKQLWTNRDIATKTSSCVGYKGYIYGVSEGGKLLCINSKDGKTVWSESRMGMGTVALSEGKLIVLSEKGELIIAEATEKGFTPISRTSVLSNKCWVVPVLANGRIYCRSNRGDLVCVDVRK